MVILFLLSAAAGILGCAVASGEGDMAGRERLEIPVMEEQELSQNVAGSDAVEDPDSRLAGGQEGESDFPGIAYSLLDEETRTVYREILAACMQHEERVELSTKKEELLAVAYQAITCDYGGLFWVNGYTYTIRTKGEEIAGIEFSPSYLFSPEDRELYQGYIDQTVAEYLAQLPEGASDYEKVRYVYEMLIYNVKYNASAKENQNILSVFLFGESVCSGIASAAQYMLGLLDIPSMLVYGMSENEPHAWNLVYIDGEPYFLDVTWGITASEMQGSCSYAFLNLTDRDIEQTHTIDMEIPVPECTAVRANYYVMENRYFTVFDEAKIGAALAACYGQGIPGDIKCATDEVYTQIYQTFVTEQKLADYCPGIQSISYLDRRELRLLTFIWK